MLTTSSPFSSALTKNFALGEFALNRPERRFVAQHQVDTALRLATFLELVRAQFGRPVVVTSGYRPWVINAKIGGARFSEHLYDKPGTGAVDFYLPGVEMVLVEGWIDKRWPYSLGLAAARRGFIHLGVRPSNVRARWQY